MSSGGNSAEKCGHAHSNEVWNWGPEKTWLLQGNKQVMRDGVRAWARGWPDGGHSWGECTTQRDTYGQDSF